MKRDARPGSPNRAVPALGSLSLADLAERFYGVLAGIVVVLLTWLAGHAAVFDLPDAYLYEAAVSARPPVARPDPRVVLIEVSQGQMTLDDRAWNLLVRQLEAGGALGATFLFQPIAASQEFYRRAAANPRLLFAQALEPRIGDARRLEPAAPAPGAEGQGLALAPLVQPIEQGGIYRWQPLAAKVGDRIQPTLPVVAATVLLGTAPAPGRREVLVNFNAGPGAIPRVSLTSALAGGLVPELLRGRMALVGPVLASSTPALRTPMGEDEPISMSEFAAYATNSLATRDWIARLESHELPALLLLFAVGSLIVFQRVGIGPGTWILLGGVAGLAALAWLALHFGRLWMPAAECLTVAVAMYAVIYRRRALVQAAANRKLLTALSIRMKERVLAGGLRLDEEKWSQVIVFVDQALYLTRGIFLERVGSDYRLKEVKALRCSLADIGEKRRDFRRPPYTVAMQRRTPVMAEGFLVPLATPEQQYIVPLAIGEEVLGFWAFGVDPAHAADTPGFLSIASAYAAQVSDLLYRHQLALEREKAERLPRWQRLFRFDSETDDVHGLNKAFGALDRRLSGLRNLFDRLGTAAIVYDLFGRVLHINQRMGELLNSAGIRPYDMTALDVIRTLARLDQVGARRVLNAVTFEGREVTLQASLGERAGFLASVCAIRRDVATQAEAEDGELALQIEGVLIELTDASALQRALRLKHRLLSRINHLLDVEAGVLSTSLSTLSLPERLPEERTRDLEHARTTTEKLAHTLRRTQELLEHDLEQERVGPFPIDVGDAVRGALGRADALVARSGLRTSVRLPENLPLAYAEPEGLGKALDAVVGFLVTDSEQGGELSVVAFSQDGRVELTLENRGYGMPNERFREHLEHPAEAAAPDRFAALHAVVAQAALWGGEVDARSAVGQGTGFTIILQGFA